MKRFPLIILIFTLFSCSTDDVETVRAGLIKEVKKDSITLRTFQYDEQDRITNETTYKYNRPEFVYNYEYKGDTTYIDVTLSQVPWRNEKLYRFDENEIRRESYVDGTLSMVKSYRWEEETTCGYTEVFWDYVNHTDIFEKVIYFDEICSERRLHVAFYQPASHSSGREIYKDEMQAFDAAALPPPLEEAPGNTISYIIAFGTDGTSNSINTSLSYDSVFTYNQDDYPISEIRTHRDGTVHTYTYEYY